jgi:hypothetical protein
MEIAIVKTSSEGRKWNRKAGIMQLLMILLYQHLMGNKRENNVIYS